MEFFQGHSPLKYTTTETFPREISKMRIIFSQKQTILKDERTTFQDLKTAKSTHETAFLLLTFSRLPPPPSPPIFDQVFFEVNIHSTRK